MIFTALVNLLRLLVSPWLLFRRARAAPAGAYVHLVIDGAVADLPAASSPFGLARFRRARSAPLSVAEVRRLVRVLVADPHPAGLFVDIASLRAGPAVLTSLREALAAVRRGGKDLVVYLPRGADNGALYVASAARRILVGPETTVAPLGYAVHGRYVRRALEIAGVEPEVFATGAYKSAGESLVLDTMSDAQREQLGGIVGALHDTLAGALAEGRGVDRASAERWIDEAPYGATRAVELGIVDAVAYEDELAQKLLGATGAFVPVPADRYLRARRGVALRPLGARGVLGVVEVHGPIVSAPRFSLGAVASEQALVATLRAAQRSPAVRGVVLHIDSPGGSALASDRIHREVKRLAAAKPVVAYMSNVAASGGYYIAAGAHVIVAQPQTVTGSIGVVSARFVLRPLLERLGVFTDVVKRGARADLFSPSRSLDAGERAVVEGELASFYRTFLRVVAEGRNKPVELIEPLAGGRVYSGADAHARGLVDHLGGFERAVDELRGRLGEAGAKLQPRLLRSPRATPPPLPLPAVAAARAALDTLGLDALADEVAVALDLGGDRVLAYWPNAARPR